MSLLTGLVRGCPALFAVLLAGCAPGAFLPESGPTREEMINGAQLRVDMVNGQRLNYALVRLSVATMSVLRTDEEVPAQFADAPVDRAAAGGQIDIGDVVSVSIFESSGGGLFLPPEGSARTGNSVTLPNQQVDKTGNITVPYAGLVHVAGQTTHAVEQVINERLGNRALEPQAVVTVVDRRARAVSVLGETNTAAHFSLDPGGQRLLQAITYANGPKYPAYETMVTLQRDGQVYRALLSEVAQNPAQNVQLQPGDSIYLSHEPRYFLALGATGFNTSLGIVNRRFPFGDVHLSLADGLATAGGLQDALANPRGVFVFRFENPDKLAALGISLPAGAHQRYATVYLCDLTEAGGYFYAKNFALRNDDTIYASNAPQTDLIKLLQVIEPMSNVGANVKIMSQ